MGRILLAGALLTFVVVGGWQLTVPGLYYDELLFVDAALGHPNGQFRDFSLGPVPIMLMTYIGALKAWLYFPIFQLFSVSAYSVRLPVLLIGALTLWIHARMLERAFSRQTALVFLPLAAVEPSTLLHTRLDWGPTALMMLLRALLLLGVVSWIRTREPRFLWLALGAAALGTFDKLNFLWFGPALLLALVLVYPGVIHDFWRQQRRQFLAVLGGGGAAAALLLAYTSRVVALSDDTGTFDPLYRFAVVRQLLTGEVAGVGVYSVVTTRDDLWSLAAPHLQILLVAGAGALLCGLWQRQRIDWRMLVFLALFFLFTLLALYLTPQATGPHHLATLVPSWLFALAVLLAPAFEGNGRWHRAVAGLAALLIVVVCGSSLRMVWHSLEGFAAAPKPAWDAGSTRLAETLRQFPGQPIVTVDWGSATTINGLTDGGAEILDEWPLFLQPLDEERARHFEALLPRQPLFVVPAEGKANFPATRETFFAAASARGWTLQRLSTIPAYDSTPLYELYRAGLPTLPP